MKLFLALSCLQGRPMQSAAEALLALKPDGLQLTAGNAPTVGFLDWVDAQEIPVHTHHGFHARAIRQRVWTDALEITGRWHSVHPPHKGPADWMPDEEFSGCLETMYPGEPLGSGEMVEAAMARALPLAVDVSHIFIQRTKDQMSEATWQRLQNYTHIEEIHVSANHGDRDSHKPLMPDSFGLEWARERANDGTPVMLECYMHKLSDDDRKQQMDIVRGHQNGRTYSQILEGRVRGLPPKNAGRQCPPVCKKEVR